MSAWKQLWALAVMSVLIATMIAFGWLAWFKPGPISNFELHLFDQSMSGAHVLFGFAFLLAIILLTLWKDLRLAFIQTATRLWFVGHWITRSWQRA